MTHLHFTLETEEIQKLIDHSVKDDLSKTILTTVFQQLMEEQRTQYIQATEYERSDKRVSQRNGYYELAIRKSFSGVSWQRCQVHFMRNILSSIPKKDSLVFREAIKSIFRFTDIQLARSAKNKLLDSYSHQNKYEKACLILDEGFEDAFQYTVVGKGHSRLKSTNLLERLNQEIRRREKVIRIFPNIASANRLIGAVLIDIHEEWLSSSRKYIQF